MRIEVSEIRTYNINNCDDVIVQSLSAESSYFKNDKFKGEWLYPQYLFAWGFNSITLGVAVNTIDMCKYRQKECNIKITSAGSYTIKDIYPITLLFQMSGCQIIWKKVNNVKHLHTFCTSGSLTPYLTPVSRIFDNFNTFYSMDSYYPYYPHGYPVMHPLINHIAQSLEFGRSVDIEWKIKQRRFQMYSIVDRLIISVIRY